MQSYNLPQTIQLVTENAETLRFSDTNQRGLLPAYMELSFWKGLWYLDALTVLSFFFHLQEWQGPLLFPVPVASSTVVGNPIIKTKQRWQKNHHNIGKLCQCQPHKLPTGSDLLSLPRICQETQRFGCIRKSGGERTGVLLGQFEENSKSAVCREYSKSLTM